MIGLELEGEEGYASEWAWVQADCGSSRGAGQASDQWFLSSKDLWNF